MMKKVKLQWNEEKQKQQIQLDDSEEGRKTIKYKLNEIEVKEWYEITACSDLVEDICGSMKR